MNNIIEKLVAECGGNMEILGNRNLAEVIADLAREGLYPPQSRSTQRCIYGGLEPPGSFILHESYSRPCVVGEDRRGPYRAEITPEEALAVCQTAIRPRKGVHCYATPDPSKGYWEEGDELWEYPLP